MPILSAVIITKNEATNIARCIQSLNGLVAEIIIVDAFSTDDTVQIAKNLGARVVQKEWDGYSQNKNYGNQLAKNDWIISHPDWNIRLFNRKVAQWKGDFVHEKLTFPTNTNIIRLEGLLHHYSYRTSAEHWQRIERYTQLSAQQLFQDGKKATFIKLWLAPITRFFKTYFLKKGFLDGKAGWIISIRNAYLVYIKYRLLREYLRDEDYSPPQYL